jgi:hypothetical protein
MNYFKGHKHYNSGIVEGLNERVDQTRPYLTFVGEMLFTEYIESRLAGTVAERPRPWVEPLGVAE